MSKLPVFHKFGLLPIGAVFRVPGKDKKPYRKVQTHRQSNQLVNATLARTGNPEFKNFDFEELVEVTSWPA